MNIAFFYGYTNNIPLNYSKEAIDMETDMTTPSYNRKQRSTLNAPSYAYKAVYSKKPDFFLPGRTDTPRKIWRGIDVDEHMKEDVLERLNYMPYIEGRSSEEGKSDDRPAFFVFRVTPELEGSSEEIAEELRKQGLKSLAEPGTAGRPRVVAADRIKYGDPEWEEWWNSLPDKIQYAVNKTRLKAILKDRL